MGASIVSLSGNSTETIMAYGQIYTHDNEVGQSIPTGTTYTQLCPVNGIVDWDDVLNCTPREAQCDIQIDVAGLYRLVFTATSKVDTNNTILRTVLFKNEEEISSIHSKRIIRLASEESSASIEGIIRLEIDDIISVRVRHGQASAILLTNEYANLNIFKIDD